MPRHPHPGGGFTLLEMLVALALMAVLAAGLYMSLHTGFHARERAEAAVAPVRSAALALELLRQDIASAPPPTGVLTGSFVGLDAQAETSTEDADSLVFFSAVEQAGRAAPGIRKLEFSLAATEDGDGSALVRRVTTNLLAPITPEPAEEVLCRDVISLNLRYFDGFDWLDSWDSAARGNILPLAVEVGIRVRVRDALARPGAAAPGDTAETEAEGYALTRMFLLPCGALPSEEGATAALPSSR